MSGLAKAAALLLGNSKTRKRLPEWILALVVLLFLPLVALTTFFRGLTMVDSNQLTQQLRASVTEEHLGRLSSVEAVMHQIEDQMAEHGMDAWRTKEAQVLYVLALSEASDRPDFPKRLASCFSEGQSDGQLVTAVNREFGTDITEADFQKVMGNIRNSNLSTDGYIDPGTKNNLDLVCWARFARSHHWGYVWGTYGQVLTAEYLNAKAEQYPEEVGGMRDFIQTHWVGGRAADCIGLIKGYGWLNPQTHEIEYATNGFPDVGANGIFRNATEKGPIRTIPEVPGVAVWTDGHIGIYIGDGAVIEAMGTRYGVVETRLADGPWTHWLKIPYITYLEEAPAPTEGAAQ